MFSISQSECSFVLFTKTLMFGIVGKLFQSSIFSACQIFKLGLESKLPAAENIVPECTKFGWWTLKELRIAHPVIMYQTFNMKNVHLLSFRFQKQNRRSIKKKKHLAFPFRIFWRQFCNNSKTEVVPKTLIKIFLHYFRTWIFKVMLK